MLRVSECGFGGSRVWGVWFPFLHCYTFRVYEPVRLTYRGLVLVTMGMLARP